MSEESRLLAIRELRGLADSLEAKSGAVVVLSFRDDVRGVMKCVTSGNTHVQAALIFQLMAVMVHLQASGQQLEYRELHEADASQKPN